MEQINLINGTLLYEKDFIVDNHYSLFEALRSTINWSQDDIKMFGKTYKIPRLQAWYGDKDLTYSYSGIQLNPLAWTPELSDIKSKIEAYSGYQFNSVLANLYRDGNDSNGWHADNEKELGVNPVIASVSLGEPRFFQLKHRKTKDKYKILLENGSLLIMSGEMQHHWLHQIPKTAKPINGRINITFRIIA